MKTHLAILLATSLVLCMITGCSLSYTINDPQVSSFQYDSVPQKKTVIKLVDERKDLNFQRPISNLQNITIKLVNAEDPIKWFAASLEKELTARGIPVEVIVSDKPVVSDMILTVKTYQIVSHRVSGFSPWETFHSFRGELKSGDQTSSIVAYFTNGKVPVWSMDEVEKPCFNIPMSIVVKDVASKINQKVFKFQAGKDKLNRINARITEKLAGDQDEACIPLIELGATNNLEGIPTLVSLSDHQDIFVRACSLSALGTLGPQNQIDFLKQKYSFYDSIDRIMALKAIAEIGSPDADNFIKKSRSDSQYQSENRFLYFVNLYLGE